MDEKAQHPPIESPTAELDRYRKQLTTLQRRDALLKAIALAAKDLMACDDLQQSITAFMARLGEATDADHVYIFGAPTDVGGTRLIGPRHIWTASGAEPRTDSLGLAALTETVGPRWVERLKSNQAVHGPVHSFPADEQQALAAHGIQSIAVVPIFVDEDWWEFMGFDARCVEKDWSPAEIEALKSAASIIGATLQRWKADAIRREAEQKIRSQVEHLAALHDVIRVIGNFLDLDKIFRLTLERACELFQAPMGTAYLADLVQDVAVQRAVVGLPKPQTATTVPIDTSFIGQVIITARPLFIERYLPVDPSLVGESHVGPLSARKAEAAAFVPLAVGEHVLATMNLFFDAPRSFSDDERSLLTAIGRQVGAALANARLYQEILSAEKETRRRAEQLAALHEIDQAINSSLEPAAVYACIVEQAAGLLDCQVATLWLWDQTCGEAISVASFVDPSAESTDAQHQRIAGQRSSPSQSPIIKEMLDTQAPLAIADAEHDPRISPDRHSKSDIRALLALPLTSRDQTTGFLYLIDQTDPRQWSQDEITLASQLAAQAAIAIENARLFEAEQRARQTSETLQETAHIVNASLDLDQSLNLLLEQLRRLVPYDSAAVFLEEGERLYVAAGHGFPDPKAVMRLTVQTDGNSLLSQAIETRQPVVLTDAHQDERFQAWAGTEYVRGWIGAPLLVGTALVGFMTIDSHQPDAYDEESARLAQALADQAAVTIHKVRLLADLKRANQALLRLDELKDQFIQNVAHELRTPLTLVRGNLSLLVEGGLDPETQKQAIYTAVNHAETLVQLVEGITTLQELDVKASTPQPMNLRELVATVIQLARQKVVRAGIELKTDCPPDLQTWPGDFVLLSQALYQLLDNAVKFSPDGGVVILRLSTDPDRHELQIEVEDQGIGVPLAEQESIFDLFYQADGTTTRRFGGTGLGLSIVQRVVHAHGGRIWVESPAQAGDGKYGPGSRFVIRLPRAR